MNLVPKLLEAGLKVIDMSADFRLKNPDDYEKWYGWKHATPKCSKKPRTAYQNFTAKK